MTTPTGTISLNDVNVELGLAGTTNISMNQANVRTLAGVGGSGTIISMNDLRGKSNRVTINYTFSANTANAALNLSALGGYVSGKSDITVTINSGVYLYATTTSGYGLNLSGATTGDTVTIVNNGYIMGMGGNGFDGNGALTTDSRMNGFPGGPALNLNIGVNPTINNTDASAYIGGGGGAGGGMHIVSYGIVTTWPGGGGAGGGKGGNSYGLNSSGVGVITTGGAGGGIGSSGSNGQYFENRVGMAAAGGGGRVFPSTSRTLIGTAVATVYAGLGGTGGGTGTVSNSNGTASSIGGGPNQAGSATGGAGIGNSGGGAGGWGASGSVAVPVSATYYVGSGGAGGKAVNLNGRSVTWVLGNTSRVYGAIS
jgi:hypothetical protein